MLPVPENAIASHMPKHVCEANLRPESHENAAAGGNIKIDATLKRRPLRQCHGFLRTLKNAAVVAQKPCKTGKSRLAAWG
jgi:hypothetical protein